MKRVNSSKNKILKNSRHIRWNWERSPENEMMVRYIILVVDDKGRKGIMNQAIISLQKYSSLVPIREEKFDVKDSKLKALLNIYDSEIKPEIFEQELHFTRKPYLRDKNLYERERGSLENYIDNFFNFQS